MKKSFLVVSMLLSAVAAFANDNVLQTIQIEPIRDTYNIVLISDKVVDVRKEVEEPGSVLLSLKGVRASEMLNTVYNGSVDIDSVVVTPKSDDLVEIRVKGDNVERSTVTFESLTSSIKVASAPKKEIVLNKPMKNYAPVVPEVEDVVEAPATSTIAPIGRKILNTLKNIYNNETNKNIINFGFLALMLFYGLRLVRSKDTEEIKVGLAQGLAEREINLYKQMQTPVANNYATAPQKPYTSMNYGLNAYRNVNRNPYEAPSTPKVQKSVATSPVKKSVAPVRPTLTLDAEPAEAIKVATAVAAPKKNIDNVKFLETMTAIYEKSGRHDLAQGIKANLSKVK